MKLLAFAMLVASLFLGCVEEYNDSIELRPDGSAVFMASLFPCDPDSSLLNGIKEDYESVSGVKFDTAWFTQEDSAYSLNFKISFENLLTWQSNEKIEKDFIGAISLKKIDSLENGYSFERVINGGAESKDGFLVPEDNISQFVLGQIPESDSSLWEYSIILPQGAALINSEPIDAAFQSDKPNVLHWRIPASEAASKRISFKVDYRFPSEKPMSMASIISIISCFVVMLIAIALLVRKLKNLGTTLEALEIEEKNYKED
ncbi:MAG: hypothetical protein LBH25_15005 [Fibromonadaceae bacterium]|jgi:hypothetical protein|nr:hypothetical protein [Fibromonadaceae bacterium]